MAVASETTEIHYKFDQFPESIHEEMKEWFKKSNEVKIFITGKVGAGKSTLVNGLVGRECAKEGDTLNPETSKVKGYDFTSAKVKVKVWDSPGLHDGTPNEEKYLKDMKAKCSRMDICIYCVSMLQTRYFNDCHDMQVMKKLTATFGKELWKNTLFVLTFANVAEDTDATILEAEDAEKPALFKAKVEKWRKVITDTLINDIGVEKIYIVKDGEDYVEVVPAGHHNKPALLDRIHWLSPFWFAALYKTNPRAQPALVKLNRHRIVANHSQIEEDDLKRYIHEQPIIFSERGAEIGERYGRRELGEQIGLEFSPNEDDFDIELTLIYELHMKLQLLAYRLKILFRVLMRNIFELNNSSN